MIIDKLIITDFGVYAGEQTFDLTPVVEDRPVVLVGGLNGGGKTTFLDAIQLCLYGKFALSSNRGGLSYPEYLKRCINKDSKNKKAKLQLTFRHVSDGTEIKYEVSRSWSGSGKSVSEEFCVIKDGEADDFLAENWVQFVESILPRKIANLFLFDGEKIEGFASTESAASLIATATHTLLGMDVVEQLERDLEALKQRKSGQAGKSQIHHDVNIAKEEYDHLTKERQEAVQYRAELKNKEVTIQKRLSTVELEFSQKGGDVFERQKDIERELDAAKSKVQEVEAEIRKLASGDLPLILIPDLLSEVHRQVDAETAAQKAADFVDLTKDRDKEIIELVSAAAVSNDVLKTLRNFLNKDLKTRMKAATHQPCMGLSNQAALDLQQLLSKEASLLQGTLSSLMADLEAALSVRERKVSEKASVPAEDTIQHLVDKRDQARQELEDVSRLIEQEDRNIQRLDHLKLRAKQKLSKLIEKKVRLDFEQEDTARLISHATKTQATLVEFRSKVIKQHIKRIESHIEKSFKSLLRKGALIKSLKIDPETFHIDLLDGKKRVVPPERLSAGERQLLAVATLWGLAKASNRLLPTVIDTPLGRLDTKHRLNLVTRYFPVASHQVILLSTDEEISGKYLRDLEGHVGRTYELVFDEKQGATKVVPGYFEEVQLNAH